MVQYQWRNLIRKVDHTMSDPNLRCVICTDFGASLDLSATEKDNSSVDNHAVLCILFFTHNWRRVKFKREVRDEVFVDDEIIVNDCEKLVFFGNTMSTDNNDHVLHNACQTYLIKYYDSIRVSAGKGPILYNIT